MNQTALSAVLLRLMGVYIIYTVASLFINFQLPQLLALRESGSVDVSGYFVFSVVGWVIQAALGLVFVFLADRISSRLFKENKGVILEGSINGSALLHVGVGLIGVYFLVSNLPKFTEFGFRWFVLRASDNVSMMERQQQSQYGFFAFQGGFMVLLALAMIIRRRTLCDWMNRVSR